MNLLSAAAQPLGLSSLDRAPNGVKCQAPSSFVSIKPNGFGHERGYNIYLTPERLAQYAQQRLKHEIAEQPEVLTGLLKRYPSEALQSLLPQEKPQRLVLLAEGSSRNAAQMAKPWLEALTHLPVDVLLPEDSHFQQALQTQLKQAHKSQSLLVPLSQSGKSSSLLKALAELLQQNDHAFSVLPVCNTPESPLVKDHPNTSLLLGAGEEKSIAATKSMSSSFMALVMLGEAMAAKWPETRALKAEGSYLPLEQAPQKLESFLQRPQTQQTLEALAQRWAAVLRRNTTQSVGLLSTGAPQLAMPEAGLKLCETNALQVHTQAMEGFKHGPKVILDNEPLLLYVLPPAQSKEQAQTFFNDMQEHKRGTAFEGKPATKKAFLLRFENSEPVPPEVLDPSQVFTLPAIAPDPFLQSLMTLAALQSFSLELATARHLNPNHPALSKAVVTPTGGQLQQMA
jgi:glutamine---fructose-6-phosphate transaminase (isomerizing)